MQYNKLREINHWENDSKGRMIQRGESFKGENDSKRGIYLN